MKKVFLFALTACLVCQLAAETTSLRVACVGNSITQGSGIRNQLRDSYPGLLGQMLGEGYEVRNYGYSGRTLLNKGDRPYMKETMYQDALAFCPHIVTIKLGTNDTKPFNWVHKEDYPKQLREMIRSFQQLPTHPRIIVCHPVPAYRADWGINDSLIRTEVIPYIDTVAAEMGVEVIDLYEPFSNRPEWFVDGIHPNEAGAFELAKILYSAITKQAVPESFRPQSYPGVRSQWKGYDCYRFAYKERQVTMVLPNEPAAGRPWIWRPAFFGAYAQVDEALLAKGYAVVCLDVANEFASPSAMAAGNALYGYLVKHCGLSNKVVLEGFSRGGLYAIRWAAANPSKVSCLYLDAPVCSVTSWPSNHRSEWANEWQQFCRVWQWTDNDAQVFDQQTWNAVDSLAHAAVPIVLVAGKKDLVVPFKENGKIVEKKYRQAGAPIQTYLKKKGGHHPHSLDDPMPIVEFILNR